MITIEGSDISFKLLEEYMMIIAMIIMLTIADNNISLQVGREIYTVYNDINIPNCI